MDVATEASAMYFVIDCFLSNSSALILASCSLSSLNSKKKQISYNYSTYKVDNTLAKSYIYKK